MSIEENLNVGVVSSDKDGKIEVIDNKQQILDKDVILPEIGEKEVKEVEEIITSNNNNVIVEIDDDREKDGPIA